MQTKCAEYLCAISADNLRLGLEIKQTESVMSKLRGEIALIHNTRHPNVLFKIHLLAKKA